MRSNIKEASIHDYLQRLESLVRAFDFLSDHVVITDSDANILYANSGVEKMTGFTKREAVGKNPADLWGGKMPKDFYEKMWHTIKIEKKPFVGEVKNVRKDGSEYWQEVHISPILDEHGEVLFFIGIEPNITDRKEREKFREEFISIVGHQLQNPLATIKWALDWLQQRGGLQADQQKAIQELYAQNQNLIHLIGDLLVLSRIGGRKGAIREEALDLGVIIREIVAGLQKRFLSVDFSVTAKGTYPLTASSMLISSVFENIILNAAEYSNPARGIVRVALTRQGASYEFTCSDNGIGIPETDQPNIFGQFFRASNAKERKKLGTGLGLFIAKMIADTMNWRISFKSREGEGTTFTIVIPLATPLK